MITKIRNFLNALRNFVSQHLCILSICQSAINVFIMSNYVCRILQTIRLVRIQLLVHKQCIARMPCYLLVRICSSFKTHCKTAIRIPMSLIKVLCQTLLSKLHSGRSCSFICCIGCTSISMRNVQYLPA